MKRSLIRSSVRAIALVLGLVVYSNAWAAEMINPVTGETETYANTFTGGSDGTGTDWNDASNWDTSVTPFISGDYSPSLVSNKTASTATAVDGWTPRVGAYDGATVTWSGGISKIQAGSVGAWLTADATSTITIASFGGNQLEGSDTYPLKLTSAKAGGITWSAGLTSASNTSLPFWYYLKGDGTVVYGGDITVANAQVIKAADVTLSGNEKSVQSKTLVSFGSGTTKTFSADAAIKVYGTDGETLVDTVNTATINTTGSTTLTADSAVGSVELVQTSTGIVLYYVDGDPTAIVAKTYKPSISVNFTSGTALSTAADVGVGDYAIPGTSWNNLVGNNGTLSTVVEVDENGDTATVSGATVTISGTRGYWKRSGLSATSDLREGYIDDADGNASPTVTVTGIPYYSYKLVVYFSNDTDGRQLGHLTVNGTNYKWDSTEGAIVTCEGTQSDVWGSTDGTAYTEGGNYLVFPTQVNTDGNLTIVGHRWSGTLRAGVAAIQIVEVKPEAGEGDKIIEVSGDTTYTVNSAETFSGTVYVIGEGTLTFDGSATLTAATLEISKAVTVNMNSSALSATTVIGSGTALYDGVKPTTGLGWTDSANWTGTVWVKNITTSSNERKDWNPALYGNEESTLRFTDVNLYFPNNTTTAFSGTVELDAGGLNICDGYGGSIATFARLSGSGTLSTSNGSSNGNGLTINDASAFTGTITLTKFKVIIGTSTGTSASGVLQIDSGAVATVASGKTWTAPGGFVVNGTLNADGTLASSNASQAVSGSGTVVFTGRAPTPTSDTWWKNAAWTGTVQMKNVTNLVGGTNWTGTNFLPNDYGNTGSVLELYNCSGWLPNDSNYQCTVPLKVTGTLTINNGISGTKFVISSLSGSGTIYTSNNSATTTLQVLEASGFTGKVQLNSKRVVFGNTLPSEYTVGNIYVGEGFSFTVPNSSAAWYGIGGITLAGELKAAALSNFGGGTTITTTDTGVFTLVSNSNADDMNVDYTRIQGTGTLKFEGSAYRCISTNNFPTAMIVENNLTAGLLHRIPNLEVTIGSLSGSGYLRSDWGGSAGDRSLKVLQAKDTTWSGKFWTANPHRFGTLRVAPGASTAGTLTISATHEAAESTALQVDSGASVNLTGTWVGNTTVSGTFGGTGTLTGNLTFNAGATFKAFASDENGLAVSGTVTYPAEGTVTVDVSALTETTGKVVLMTAPNATLAASNFALASGQSGELLVEDNALKVDLTTYAASYGGTKYQTVQEAINAAEQAGDTYADVTILDPNATCPDGYYIDTENNNALTLYQAAIIQNNEGAMTTNYFTTAQLAVDALEGAPYTYSYYSHFEVYSGTAVSMTVNPSAGSGALWTAFSVKVKCLNGSTVAVAMIDSTEYELTAGTADDNGIVTYTKTDKATTYVWAGATSDSASTSKKNYARADNWKVGTSSGATATRAPGSLDTVVFGNGAYASTTASQSVAALQVSGTVTIIGGGSLTSASAITLGEGDSITITGTLSPEPTAADTTNYRVRKTTADGTTTYTVVDKVGTIFSVY